MQKGLRDRHHEDVLNLTQTVNSLCGIFCGSGYATIPVLAVENKVLGTLFSINEVGFGTKVAVELLQMMISVLINGIAVGVRNAEAKNIFSYKANKTTETGGKPGKKEMCALGVAAS